MAYGFPPLLLVPLVLGAGAATGLVIGYSIVEDLRSQRKTFMGDDALLASEIDGLLTQWNEWVKAGGKGSDASLLSVGTPPSIVYTPTQNPALNDLLMDYWIMRAALASQDNAFVALYLKRDKEYQKHVSEGKPLTSEWAAQRYKQTLSKFASIAKGMDDPTKIRKAYTTLQYLSNPSSQSEQEAFNELQRINAWDDFVVPTIDQASRPVQLAAALISGKRPSFLTQEQWRLIQLGVYGTVGFMLFQTVSAYIPKPKANPKKRYKVR